MSVVIFCYWPDSEYCTSLIPTIMNPMTAYQSNRTISPRAVVIWRIVQTLVWLIGMFIFVCLIFYPKVGLIALWNVLIPVAPALLIIEGGLWRNVCPLATVNLLPRHLNLSKKKIMPASLQAKLQLGAVIALFIIVVSIVNHYISTLFERIFHKCFYGW